MSKYILSLAILLCLTSPQSSNAATASAVGVSGVAVSGTTITVTTAAAHNLFATLPNGFCLSGSSVTADNVCGVVTSAPTSTTFTFTASGLVACASSCGTLLPAKKIIWLATNTVSGGYQVNYLLWVATTSGVSGKASAWSGASQQENNALLAGAFIEVSRGVFFPAGTTLAQAQAQMVLDWTAEQAAQTASIPPGAFYGDYFDTGWAQ